MTLSPNHAGVLDDAQPAFVHEAAALFPGGGIGPSDATLRSLYPAMIQRAEGAWLYTSEGAKLLDFVMGGSALILGHGDAHVTAAIAGQVGRGTHYYQILHEPALRFGAKLVETIPIAEKLIFTSTGSDAVQQALRLARAKTGRPGVLKFTGAYHGTNDVALVGMSSPQGRNMGQADAGGIDPAGLGNVFAVARGDLRRVEMILRLESDRIACVLIDPLQRWLRPDPAFLAGLRALCDQYGVLLVFDEVVTGYRLSLGGAQQHWAVLPDIAAYGKIIGGGLPLGAVVGSADIMDMADARSREAGTAVATSGTFNANVLACTAGLATIERLVTPGFYEGLAEAGADSRAAAYETGDLAVLPGGTIENFDIVRLKDMPNTCVDAGGWQYSSPLAWLWINNRTAPMDNPKFRQAIMYALDRELALDVVWNGFGKVAKGPIASTTPFFSDAGPTYAHDPEKAKALLKEIGYDGKPLRYLPLPYGETWQRWAELIKQNLAEVGIPLETEATDVAGWNQKTSQWDYDLAFTFVAQNGDPELGVARNYITSQINQGNPFNNVEGYSNPEVDDLFAKAAVEVSTEKRQALYDQIQTILQGDVPVEPSRGRPSAWSTRPQICCITCSSQCLSPQG